MRQKHIGFREGVVIHRLITENARITGGDNPANCTVIYNVDWSDERVLAEASKALRMDMSLTSLRRFRVLNVGKVPTGRGGFHGAPSNGHASLLTDVAMLKGKGLSIEQRLAAIEQHLADRNEGFRPISAEEDVVERVRDFAVAGASARRDDHA